MSVKWNEADLPPQNNGTEKRKMYDKDDSPSLSVFLKSLCNGSPLLDYCLPMKLLLSPVDLSEGNIPSGATLLL